MREGSSIKWYITDENVKKVLEAQDFEPKRGYKVIEANEKKKIFVKSFKEKGFIGYIRNSLFPRGKKEYQVFKKLKLLSIETAQCLGYGVSSWGSFSVWEYLAGENYLRKFNEVKDRILLIKMLAEFLNSLKDKGVRHNDLHLENLFVIEDRVILVDLHKVKIKKRLSKEDELSNISQALHMIYMEMSEREKEMFFTFYDAIDIRTSVEQKLEMLKKVWIKRKIKRAFRETSVVSVCNGYRFIKGFENIKEGEFIATLKKDKKVEVLRYENCIKKVYKTAFRLKRAWRNSVVLEYMRAYLTPRTFAVKLPGLLSPGFILIEDLARSGGVELDRYLDREYERMSLKERKMVVKAFSSFLVEMIKYGIFHRDLKGCNIFVGKDKRFFLLDVEDVDFKTVGPDEVIRMLTKLNNTVPKKVPMKDRLRVLSSISTFSKRERKRILKMVKEMSKNEEIVYEGQNGLIVAQWER